MIRRRRIAAAALGAALAAGAVAGCGRGERTDSTAASPADREVAQRIRQALAGDESLSASAKTVAIVSDRGTVVLRGAVTSDRERTTVADRARHLAAGRRVDDQLRVVRKE